MDAPFFTHCDIIGHSSGKCKKLKQNDERREKMTKQVWKLIDNLLPHPILKKSILRRLMSLMIIV